MSEPNKRGRLYSCLHCLTEPFMGEKAKVERHIRNCHGVTRSLTKADLERKSQEISSRYFINKKRSPVQPLRSPSIDISLSGDFTPASSPPRTPRLLSNLEGSPSVSFVSDFSEREVVKSDIVTMGKAMEQMVCEMGEMKAMLKDILAKQSQPKPVTVDKAVSCQILPTFAQPPVRRPVMEQPNDRRLSYDFNRFKRSRGAPIFQNCSARKPYSSNHPYASNSKGNTNKFHFVKNNRPNTHIIFDD